MAPHDLLVKELLRHLEGAAAVRRAKGIIPLLAGLAVVVAGWSGSVAGAHSDAIVVRPGESIQAAVDAASRGDAIIVRPGVYHEAVFVGTDGLTLRGFGATILPPAEAPDTPCVDPELGIPRQQQGICVWGDFDFETGEIIDPVSNVRIFGNKPTGSSIISGGIVAFDTSIFGGGAPTDVSVKRNVALGNSPDLAWDETGSVSFDHNVCKTSDPLGLCKG